MRHPCTMLRAGLAGNHPVSIDGVHAEASYWLAADSPGRGLVGSALRLLIDWFPSIGVEQVELVIHPDDARSQHLALRAGFVDVGERPSQASCASDGRVRVCGRSLI